MLTTHQISEEYLKAFDLCRPLPYEEQTRQLVTTSVVNGKSYKNKPLAVTLIPRGNNRFTLKYPFSTEMNAEVKKMGHPKYHGFEPGGKKEWSVRNDSRTGFVINYLDESTPNPYDWYKAPIVQPTLFRDNLYPAQVDMINFGFTKRYCEWACEMGLGKSLSAIHLIEILQPVGEVLWIGPKSALAAVKYEFEKWQSPIKPVFLTYQGLTKYATQIIPGTTPPQMIIYDEASKIKNYKAQCTQAAWKITSAIREHWGVDGLAITMTGTPAPKAPTDWYSQIETVCPGFLAEGSLDDFRRRLTAYSREKYGNGYEVDKVLAWLDSDTKCKLCGNEKEDICHVYDHKFTPSKNEVAALRKRLEPIVLVRLKKDCLDLPDKRYEKIILKVDPEMSRWSQLITARATSAIQAITMLRELSDGFLYEQEEDGTTTCPVCKGSTLEVAWEADKSIAAEPIYDVVECPECAGLDGDCMICQGEGFIQKQDIQRSADYTRVERECRHCKGTGQTLKYKRVVKEIRSPKDQAVRELLERNEEVGRIALYGGFTGTIDRAVNICLKEGWDVWRCDGRGMTGIKADGSTWNHGDLLKAFQEKSSASSPNKLAFCGHPEAGGMGLTLTAACTLVYISNSYKADARIQSEDRIHRIGMDENLGALIVDLVHLPQDEAVLRVLKQNRDLQTLSMVELEKLLKSDPEPVSWAR
jgi:SNF2 family DNA or RNA helicase